MNDEEIIAKCAEMDDMPKPETIGITIAMIHGMLSASDGGSSYSDQKMEDFCVIFI